MKKVLQVKASGSFIATDKMTESFEVSGLVPALSEDKLNQMVIKRYARIWIEKARNEDGSPTYKRIGRIREVFVDSWEETTIDGDFEFVGKNIMDMSFEDLQDLAAVKDLNDIPLYKSGSLANQRRVAFAQYGGKVLGYMMQAPIKGKMEIVPLDHRHEGFDPSKHPAIVVDNSNIRRQDDDRLGIEESIDRENLVLQGKATGGEAKSRLTYEQLLDIAKTKGIKVTGKMSHDALYKLIYKPDAA